MLILTKVKLSMESSAKTAAKSGCVFCNIYKAKKDKILFQDDLTFAFYNKKKSVSDIHILVCPIVHIKNCSTLTKDNIDLLRHMQKVAEGVVAKLSPRSEYRFGYHKPPINTVEHLHLHGIVLPIKSEFLSNLRYGKLLTPTETIIQEVEQGKSLIEPKDDSTKKPLVAPKK